jgi:putative membrane protein
VRSFIFVVAVAATSWQNLLHGALGPLGWILLALLVAGAVFGAASWLRTKYWVEQDELRVDTGLISRQSRRIRIDRLQGIDIAQPFVARLFGLAELKMDVAGGSAREGSLAFLRLADAQRLKEVLLARRDVVRSGPEVAASAKPLPEQLLARVDPMMLMVSILLSPATVALLLSAAGSVVLLALTGAWTGLSAMVPIVGGLAVALFRRFVGYYNFTVSQTTAGLQVRRGLFDLSSQTIALPRVQGIVVTEPLLWRPLGWVRLDVSIAGYAKDGDNDGPSASTILPVGPRRVVAQMARHVLQGLDVDRVLVSEPPEKARWVAPVARRFLAAGIGENLVVSKDGWFTRRTHAVPHARVQSLRLSQGPWQRRLGLADLHVDSPPGPVHVRARHRLASEARRMLEREAQISRDAR